MYSHSHWTGLCWNIWCPAFKLPGSGFSKAIQEASLPQKSWGKGTEDMYRDSVIPWGWGMLVSHCSLIHSRSILNFCIWWFLVHQNDVQQECAAWEVKRCVSYILASTINPGSASRNAVFYSLGCWHTIQLQLSCQEKRKAAVILHNKDFCSEGFLTA